jgi:hypothetical protein
VNAEPNLSQSMTQEKYQWIAESAYYKALARNFTPIRDQDDWMEAKKEYEDNMLAKQQRNGLVSFTSIMPLFSEEDH